MNDAATGAHGGADPIGRPPARRRGHTFLERYLFIPIGVIWLGVLALLALPVMVGMTVLYYLTRPLAALSRAPRNRSSRAAHRRGPVA